MRTCSAAGSFCCVRQSPLSSSSQEKVTRARVFAGELKVVFCDVSDHKHFLSKSTDFCCETTSSIVSSDAADLAGKSGRDAASIFVLIEGAPVAGSSSSTADRRLDPSRGHCLCASEVAREPESCVHAALLLPFDVAPEFVGLGERGLSVQIADAQATEADSSPLTVADRAIGQFGGLGCGHGLASDALRCTRWMVWTRCVA